jgi:hypothetical protein
VTSIDVTFNDAEALVTQTVDFAAERVRGAAGTATKLSHRKQHELTAYPSKSEETVMVYKGCHSGPVREYPAEINIHFAGKENLEKPSVWVFPNLIGVRRLWLY